MNIKQVISAAGFLAFGRIINIVSQFVFNAILVRLLLKQEVGDFFLTFSFVSFLSLIVTYGSENIAIKKFLELINKKLINQELTNQEEPLRASSKQLLIAFLLVNSLTIFIVVVLVFILYTFNIIQFFNVEYSARIILVLLFWTWGQGLSVMLTEVFRAFGNFFLTVLSSGVLINVINLVLLISFYAFREPLDLESLLLLISFNAVVIAMLLLLLALRFCISFDKNNIKENVPSLFAVAKAIIKDSTPSFLNKFGIYLTILADLWLMSMFFAKDIVADYAIAAKLAVSASIFLSITNGLVPTFVAKFKRHGMAQTEQILRLLATCVALPSGALLLFLLVKSDAVISLIFGSSFVSASIFLGVLLLAQIINVMVGSCGYLLMMKGRNDYLMKISISTGALAIASTLVCMELDFGSLSIAWSFCIAAILRNILTYIAAMKLCGINTGIYLSPTLFFESIKMIKAKQFSYLFNKSRQPE